MSMYHPHFAESIYESDSKTTMKNEKTITDKQFHIIESRQCTHGKSYLVLEFRKSLAISAESHRALRSAVQFIYVYFNLSYFCTCQ